MDKVTRIGVSLEPELLEDFDNLVKKKGYTTRSEGIRDLIRAALVEELWSDSEASVVGTITLVFDVGTITLVFDHSPTVQDRLMELQHHHHANISSTVHIHISMEQCLEVLVVWGKAKEVQALADEIIAVKGVLYGKLTMTSASLDRPHAHVHRHR